MATLRMKMRPRSVTRISSSRQLDQAVFDEGLQARQFGREVVVEIDAELGGDFVLANHGVAEQAGDHGAAEAIVVAQAVAAHGGDAAALDGLGVARQLAIVLRVGAADAADGADAHAVKVGAGFGGVALKIAVQGAVALGDGQLVVGLGEMVHADVLIAGAEEFLEAGGEDAELFHALGQVQRPAAPCCLRSQGTWA